MLEKNVTFSPRFRRLLPGHNTLGKEGSNLFTKLFNFRHMDNQWDENAWKNLSSIEEGLVFYKSCCGIVNSKYSGVSSEVEDLNVGCQC